MLNGIHELRELQGQSRIIDPTNLLTMWVAAPAGDRPTADDRAALWNQMPTALGELSGVDAVAVTSALPFTTDGTLVAEVEVDGRPPGAADELPTVRVVTVTPSYFETLGVALTRGRPLRADERRQVIVDERFAGVYFPGTDPIGHRLRLSGLALPAAETAWATIVGVSPTVGQQARRLLDPVVYQAIPAAAPVTAALVVRSSSDTVSLAASIRRRLQQLDPTLPAYEIATMEEVVRASRWNARMSMMILMVVALASMGVAGVGPLRGDGPRRGAPPPRNRRPHGAGRTGGTRQLAGAATCDRAPDAGRGWGRRARDDLAH